VVTPVQNFASKKHTGVKIVFLFYAWLLMYFETSKVTATVNQQCIIKDG
jgi:hypothetical protein